MRGKPNRSCPSGIIEIIAPFRKFIVLAITDRVVLASLLSNLDKDILTCHDGDLELCCANGRREGVPFRRLLTADPISVAEHRYGIGSFVGWVAIRLQLMNRYANSDIAFYCSERHEEIRRDLQLVFQDPVGSLNPQMRVADIVSEPLLVHEKKLAPADRRQRVVDMLEQVGLGNAFLSRYPHELSGGQAQRVAIARALILKPRVLVCDEAVAALDGSVREQILRLLREQQQASGLSILFISHDLGVVRAISHRVLVMYLGRLVELADNESLFGRPQHPYTRALIDAVPVPDPEVARVTALLAGEVPSILTPPTGCAFHPRCAYSVDRCVRELPQPREVGATIVACHRAEELDL